MSAASSAGRARTVLSLSEEEREHLLACPVCMELYNRTNRQPKVLPCSHTFCKECLLGIRPPLCPFDRSDYSQSDVHRYPNNSSVLLLVGPDTGGSVGDVDDASGGQANPGVSARGVVPAVAASHNSSMYSPYQEAPHVMQPAQSTCIVINKKYYKGMPGILKFIELLSSLIAFICMSVNAQECQFNFSTLLFFKIAIMFTFVTNMLVYWSCLLSLHRTILNLSPGNTHVLAIVFYFLQVIMLFFGTYFLSIHGCEATHDAAALFGMVALLAVFVDAWRAVLLYSITDGVTVETLL